MEKAVGNWDQRKDVENDENMTECARSGTVLDGEISNYSPMIFHKELHGGVRYHPVYCRYILMTDSSSPCSKRGNHGGGEGVGSDVCG